MLEVLFNQFASAEEFKPDFALMMAEFDLWILDSLLKQLAVLAVVSRDLINVFMVILRSACCKVSQLAQCEVAVDVTDLEKRCAQIRSGIDGVVRLQSERSATSFYFPDMEGDLPTVRDLRIQLSVTDRLDASRPAEDFGAIQSRAYKNLAGIPLLSDEATVAQLLGYVNSLHGSSSAESRLLLLSTVEREMRRYSQAFDQEHGADALTQLEAILAAYSACLVAYTQSLPVNSELPVALRSKELLVTWIVYCLVHSANKRVHTVMAGFGVALRAEDLRHLVLADRADLKAALSVHSYLRAECTSRALFSQRCPLVSFQFAEQFAYKNQRMCAMWTTEQITAAHRKTRHWNEVLTKQAQAKVHRAAIATLAAEISSFKYTAMPCVGDRTHKQRVLRQREEDTMDEMSSRLRSLNSALAATLVAPAPVIQPLPEDQSLAPSECYSFCTCLKTCGCFRASVLLLRPCFSPGAPSLDNLLMRTKLGPKWRIQQL